MNRFFLGLVFGAVFFTACGGAAVKFPYNYFHITPINVWDFPGGKLLGFDSALDMELAKCKPTRKDAKGNLIQECAIILYSELNALIKDYKETKQRLIDCQKGNCQ